jgi:hypothetical protein
LFVRGQVSTTFFLNFLCIIFKHLLKKKHKKFLFFLEALFTDMVFSLKDVSKVKGIYFVASGKLSGKMRASTAKIAIGKIKKQTFNLNINYSKAHVYTLYGAYGFKLWVNN